MLFRVYFVFTYLKDNKTEEITLKITCKYWKMIHRTHIKYICWWSLELLNFVQWQQLVFGSIGNVCSCIGGSSHNLEFALDLSFEEPCHYNILEDWLSSVFLPWLHIISYLHVPVYPLVSFCAHTTFHISHLLFFASRLGRLPSVFSPRPALQPPIASHKGRASSNISEEICPLQEGFRIWHDLESAIEICLCTQNNLPAG